jgi:WD40 repeat protein
MRVGFDAFVSYSHAADGRLAPALQKAIQRFAKPWYRARALRVFRDESALSANPHLWSSIEAALDESDWFVLLASPDAVASEWVKRELDHWLAHKPRDRILVVLTDGTWEWDTSAHAVVGTAVPPVLSDAFPDEPRHVDLRWAHAESDLDMRNARFRDGVAQLAAPVHGIPKDELESEDILLHRRARRLARGGVTVLALLVVIALVASGFALVQRHDALSARDRASHNADVAERATAVATAERLGAVAASRRGVDDSQALLLAVEGYRRADSVSTRSALLGTLTATPQLVGFLPGAPDATASAISPDGHLVVAGTNDGSLRFWDTRDTAGEPVLVAPPSVLRNVPVANMKFDQGGTHLFVLYSDGRVELWNPAARTPVGAPMAIGSTGSTDISVSPDGRTIVVEGTTATTVYEVFDHRILGKLGGGAAFSRDGRTLYASAGTGLVALDAATLAPIGGPLLGGAASGASFCVASACFLLSGGGEVVTASTGTEGTGHNIVLTDQGGGSPTTNDAGSAAASTLGATVVDATTRQVLEHLAPTSDVSAIAMSPDASRVVLGGDDGSIQVWPSSGASLTGATEPSMHQDGRIVSLSLADDGASLVSTSVGGSTVLWDLNGRGALARGNALPNAVGQFHASRPRSCSATESPVKSSIGTPVRTALYENDTCSSSVSMSPTGSKVAVSADQSSVWDLASRPPRLLRTFGTQLAPIATPLAFDPAGTRVLFAAGFSLHSPDGQQQGSLGPYEIANADGGPLEEVLSPASVVSDPNSGPFILVVKHGPCCASPLTAMDVWTGRTLGSFQPRSVVDQLVRAHEADVFETPLPPQIDANGHQVPGIRASLTSFLTSSLPAHAMVDAQGRRALTVSALGDIVLWDLRTGRPEGHPIIATGRTVPAATAVAFSPDGNELAVGRLDGTIQRYSLPLLQPVGPPIAGHSNPIGQIAYQPSGPLLAAASSAAVDLIDRDTSERIATLPYAGATPLEAVFGSLEATYGDGTAQFGEDGRVLVTNGYGTDTPALFVSLLPADWVTAACAAAGRNLTRTEWAQLVGSSVPYDRTCLEWPSGT